MEDFSQSAKLMLPEEFEPLLFVADALGQEAFAQQTSRSRGGSPKKLGHGPGERPWPSDGWECGRHFAHFLCAAGYGWREDAAQSADLTLGSKSS
jgi:hypothetical protein